MDPMERDRGLLHENTPEIFQYLSAEWVDGLREFIETTYPPEGLDGIEHSGSFIAANPPADLLRDGRSNVGFNLTIRGGKIEVSYGAPTEGGGDYQLLVNCFRMSPAEVSSWLNRYAYTLPRFRNGRLLEAAAPQPPQAGGSAPAAPPRRVANLAGAIQIIVGQRERYFNRYTADWLWAEYGAPTVIPIGGGPDGPSGTVKFAPMASPAPLERDRGRLHYDIYEIYEFMSLEWVEALRRFLTTALGGADLNGLDYVASFAASDAPAHLRRAEGRAGAGYHVRLRNGQIEVGDHPLDEGECDSAEVGDWRTLVHLARMSPAESSAFLAAYGSRLVADGRLSAGYARENPVAGLMKQVGLQAGFMNRYTADWIWTECGAPSVIPIREGMTQQVNSTTRSGQIVIESTGAPGARSGETVYVLECSHCGHHHRCDGVEIADRLCPACQSRPSGT